jgi:alpha-beta hydrolase superfamily lysophospholipase
MSAGARLGDRCEMTTTRVSTRSREALIFSGATAVALVHAFDDAFLHRQPGVGLGQHALAAALSLVLGLGAIYAFPSARPAARSALALLFGALATVNGTMHVKHIADQGATASDLTGALAAAAGLVLVGLAIAIPWLHRGEGTASRRRRWTYRVVAVPVGLLAFLFTIVPMGIAIFETHKFREPIGAPPGPDYREVAFEAGDGVDLSGWYRPTQNGATVIVLHGGGSDRTGALAHAKLLVRHGYGALLYDARGRGKSEGTQNSWGWGWPEDVAGAVAFLKARDEVDPERIGALGLSTGADVLVQVAGQSTDLKAVVADGTAAGSFADTQRVNGTTAITPFMAVEFATVRLTSGSRPGPVLEDMVKRITSPLLLVSAGPSEKPFGEAYDRAAGDRPVEHWHLPGVGHTAAIREAAPEYEERVTKFFDGALSVR